MLIYETKSFEIGSAELPHIDHSDEGYVKIIPYGENSDRTDWSLELATEEMKGTGAVGEPTVSGLQMRGMDLERIEYRENGNWVVSQPDGPCLHVHIDVARNRL